MNVKKALRISRLHLPLQSTDVKETVNITGDQAHYVRNVLRLKKGHPMVFFTQDGQEYVAQIDAVDRHDVKLINIQESNDSVPPSSVNITLIQAISAGDRMDYTVQKSAEMGARALIPVFSEYCSQKIPVNKYDKKVKHWQAVANSACEQSGRCDLLQIHPITSLKAVSESHASNGVFLEPTATKKLSDLAIPQPQNLSIFIGPEGGFSHAETAAMAQLGMMGIQMGQRVLRTETAAPVILAAVHTLYGDFS